MSFAFRTCAGVCLSVCSLVSAAADAEPTPQIWLNAGFLSYHADRSQDYREDNIGLGMETMFTPDHGFFLGTYINSDDARSHYAMYQWRPLHGHLRSVSVSGGLIAGVLDGYARNDGGWFFGAAPVLFFDGERFGANLVVIPNSEPERRLVALQLKLRVY
jgi:hypothetical protein